MTTTEEENSRSEELSAIRQEGAGSGSVTLTVDPQQTAAKAVAFPQALLTLPSLLRIDTRPVLESQLAQNEVEEARKLSSHAAAIQGKDERGRYIIFWSGEKDPENPKNWSNSKKMANVYVVSLMALLAPLCSSLPAPGLPQIQQEFNASETVAALTISIFVIAFGVAPLLLAPFSETFGRQTIYNCCYPIFCVFQVGCALSTSMEMLIGFRAVAGFFGSAGIALGSGTISDMFLPHERALVVGKYVLGIVVGPVVGPIAGGFITQGLGWRWCFWILAMISGVNSVIAIILLKETYSLVLLERRARRMAKELNRPTVAAEHDNRPLSIRLENAIMRPMKILFLQPIVFVTAVYQALVYGIMYLLFTTFPQVWPSRYGFSTSQAGLAYIGLGVGFILGIVIGTPRMHRIYNELSEKNGGGKPEYRMPLANVGAVLIPISLFWYGWCVQKQVFWIVPILGTSVFGAGVILIFNTLQNYYIDAFTRYAASAVAAGSVFRAVVGATFPLFAPALYNTLDYGWGTSVLAFGCILLMPAPPLIIKYGETLRARFQVSLD